MLLSVEDAQAMILNALAPRPRVVMRPLTEAYGCLLGQDVAARDDIPPFTNTSMDGYAVRADEVSAARADHPVVLTVQDTIRAGHWVSSPLRPGHCFKIMTGAPVPETADAVVPVEWTRPAGAESVAILQAVAPGQNLRYRGEDMCQGSLVLSKGTRITAPVAGMLATLGWAEVAVVAPPKVAILSTGDELREPGEALPPGTIRNSNAYALYAAIKEAGGEPVLFPKAPDDPEVIRQRFADAAQSCDLIVSSGGVSVGDFDFVKGVIESLGTLTLWRVNLKPGKPLAFGQVLGTPVVGLPGNPVSALVTFELFVRPAIRTLLGDPHWARPVVRLPLVQNFSIVEERRHYVRARLVLKDGRLALWPHGNQGSHVQTSWQDVDALMVVPEGTGPYQQGDELEAMLLSLDHVRPLGHEMPI
ncbi:MAG: molybdopterin molybdotransferase MoeA [Firmicutes bacterium]|nr:molybdopterin molybdotransferase MoeA [Bacillota bacterium]